MGNTKEKWCGRFAPDGLVQTVTAVCLALVAAVSVAACGADSSAGEEDESGTRTYTLSTADDPNRHLFYYALINKLVEVPGLKLNVELLPFASAAEAFQSRQYDIVEANWLNVAQGDAQGFGTHIVSAGLLNRGLTTIIVPKDSPIKSPADLKGKKLGIQAQGTIFSLEARALLQGKYGVDAGIEKGEVEWVEIPEIPTLFRLLQKGDIGAIVGTQLATWQVVGDPNGPNRILTEVTKEYDEMTGADATMNTSFITYDDPAIPPEDLEAIQELLKKNTEYLKAHTDEIVAAVVKDQDVDKAYLDWTLKYLDIDLGPVTAPQKQMIESGLQSAKELGMIESVPDVNSLIFQPGS